MDVPPSLLGGVHTNTACEVAEITERPVGAPGVVNGVAVAGADEIPAPLAFIALTRNEYVVAFVSPVTTCDVPVAAVVTVDHVTPPSALFSTTYVETELPPVDVGAVHDNVTCPVPALAVSEPGAVARPTADPVKFALYAPYPPFVTAAIRKVYTTPADRLPTVKAVAVEPVFEATVVHEEPPFELRSMR